MTHRKHDLSRDYILYGTVILDVQKTFVLICPGPDLRVVSQHKKMAMADIAENAELGHRKY